MPYLFQGSHALGGNGEVGIDVIVFAEVVQNECSKILEFLGKGNIALGYFDLCCFWK